MLSIKKNSLHCIASTLKHSKPENFLTSQLQPVSVLSIVINAIDSVHCL